MNKLLLFLCWTVAVPVFGQQRFYVNTSATGLNTGLSWNDAFTQLQPALQLAADGDEVWVSKGNYRPTTSTDRTISFEPKSGVKLYGGFAGGETLLGQRDWVANETVLSGDIGVTGSALDNSYNVVYMGSGNPSTLLDGFTVSEGRADAPGFSDESTNRAVSGAGVHVNGNQGGAYPKFLNCSFKNNYAKSVGGGVLVIANLPGTYTKPQFIKCTFRNNYTLNKGSAIYKSGGSQYDVQADIDSCVFINNEADISTCVYWHNFKGSDSTVISNSIFKNNKANFGLTALFIQHNHINPTSVTVKNCNFENNFGYNTLVITGPAYPFKGSITVTGCNFVNNKSVNNILSILQFIDGSECKIHLDNLLFKHNYATESPVRVDCELAVCQASRISFIDSPFNLRSGSLMSFTTRKLYLENSVFNVNEKLGQYIGAYCEDTAKITNTIFRGNGLQTITDTIGTQIIYYQPNYIGTSGNLNLLDIEGCVFGSYTNDADIAFTQVPVAMRNSIILHPYNSPNHFFQNATAVNLSNNYFAGLDTATLPPYFTLKNNLIGIDPLLTDEASGDYHPFPYSPLINAGDSTGTVPGATDLDGNPRILGNNIDIGPYETTTLALTGTPVITPTCEGVNNGAFELPATFCGTLMYQWTGPGGTSGSSNNGLGAGGYAVTVTDTQGSSAHLDFTIPELPAPEVNFLTTPVFCGTTTGGSAKILPVSGTPPFSFLWENGLTDSTTNDLPYGVYTVQIADSKGCTAIDSVSIARAGNLTVSIDKSTPFCYGDSNGSLTILPTNGAPPFGYNWFDGTTGQGLSNLAAGMYTGTLTDALGCGINWIIPLLQPDSLTFSAPIIQPATDLTGMDGVIQLQPVGGTPPYSASWDNGQSGITLDSLPPGMYAVTVTDNNGCTATAAYEVGYTVGSQTITLQPLLLWPNPADTWINVQVPHSGKFSIRLLDQLGRTVVAREVEDSRFQIETGDLTSGIYSLQVKDKNGQCWISSIRIIH